MNQAVVDRLFHTRLVIVGQLDGRDHPDLEVIHPGRIRDLVCGYLDATPNVREAPFFFRYATA